MSKSHLSAAKAFNLDRSKTLSSVRRVKPIECILHRFKINLSGEDAGRRITLILPIGSMDIFCGKYRARSACTYVQSDLALHSPLFDH